LRDARVISSERVFVGGKIPSLKAKWASSRGTTVKTFNWRAIEQKNPFSRREQRVKRQEQARVSREAGELQRPAAPRYTSARAIVEPVRTPAPPLDPELLGVIGTARARNERWQERAAALDRKERVAAAAGTIAPERPPPE
jgi:hypothetical protein